MGRSRRLLLQDSQGDRTVAAFIAVTYKNIRLIVFNLDVFTTRASNACPSGNFTTPIGQKFSTTFGNAGCGRNLPSNDFLVVQQDNITNLTDCMAYCSSNTSAVAYGVAWDFSESPGICHCKNSTVLDEEYESSSQVDSAVAVNINLLEELCPYKNGTMQSADDGSQYQILCDTDMVLVDDFCPFTSATYSAGTDLCPMHADSLHDCMNLCGAAHPLCMAVSYVPSMSMGYGNCYPKSNVSAENLGTWDSPGDTRHMALLDTSNLDINSSCTNGTTYNSPSRSGADFDIACDTNSDAPNLITSYAQNMSACADMCVLYANTSTLPCIGVVFETKIMWYGYQNCYLKDREGNVSQVEAVHYLSRTQVTPSTSTVPNPALPSPHPRAKKTWIVGAVIGGLAGIAVTIGILWQLRRPLRSVSAPSLQAQPPLENSENEVLKIMEVPRGPWVIAHETDQCPEPRQVKVSEADPEPCVHEVDGTWAKQELGGHMVVPEVPGM
ncbi:MAG: hypothetical protein Q9165_000257 [Trypethelium subeluteriae]